MIFVLLILAHSFAAQAEIWEVRDQLPPFYIINHSEYDFEACKGFEGNELTSIDSSKDCDGKTSPLEAIDTLNDHVSKETFLQSLKEKTIKQIKKNHLLARHVSSCAIKGKEVSQKLPKCDESLKRPKEAVALLLGQMRLHQAMMSTKERPHTMHIKNLSLNEKINPDIYHPLLGIKPPKLSPEEINSALDIYDQQTFQFTQNYLEKLHKDEHPCVRVRDDVHFVTGGTCAISMKPTILNNVQYQRERNREIEKQEYMSIISSHPFLAFLNARDPYDPKIDQKIGMAFRRMANKMKEEYDIIKDLEGDSRMVLLEQKGIVEELLAESQPISRKSCNLAQTLTSTYETAKLTRQIVVGVTLGLAGVGICFATLGTGCAGSILMASTIGGGIAAEGYAIYETQSEYNEAKRQFLSGTGDLESVEEAQKNRNLALAFAPLALWGGGLGGKYAGEGALTLRANYAKTRQLQSQWVKRSQSKAFNKAVSSRPDLKTGYDEVEETMLSLIKDRNRELSPVKQDSLMRNIRNTIGNLDEGETFSTQMVNSLLNELKSPDVKIRTAAAKQLESIDYVLKQVNLTKGKGFLSRLRRFLNSSVARIKGFSDADASQLQACLVGSNSTQASKFSGTSFQVCQFR